MKTFDKLPEGEHYLKHPLEDCVLRIVKSEKGRETFVRFSKEKEYKPENQSGNIVLDALLSTKKNGSLKSSITTFNLF